MNGLRNVIVSFCIITVLILIWVFISNIGLGQ
jgi:hypothetical protein